MNYGLKQIDESQRTVSLHTVAVIAMEPEDFMTRYGFRFHTDEYGDRAALFVTNTGEQYMLARDLNAWLLGTEVLANDQSLDPERDLDRFLRVLELDSALVTWRLSHIDCFKELIQRKGWLSLLGTPLLKFVSITCQQMYQGYVARRLVSNGRL